MTGASTFHELMKDEGFLVVPHTEVPADYTVRKVQTNFPNHWIGPERYKTELKKANLVRDMLYSEGEAFGVFEQIKKFSDSFFKADPHMYGGKAFLQPGKTDAGRFLIHKYVLCFCLWDDYMDSDDDPAMGKASVHRLQRILAAHSEEDFEIPQSVRTIASEDARDEPMQLWWADFLSNVAEASAVQTSRRTAYNKGAQTFYKRLKDNFGIWLSGMEEEIDYLFSIENALSVGGQSIDLEEFWRIRINSVGCQVIYDLVMHAAQFDPNDSLYDKCRIIEWQYSTIIRAFNEVASIPKDVHDELGSLLITTMMVHKCPLDTAVDKFVSRTHKAIEDYDAHAATILGSISKDEFEAVEDFLYSVRYSAFGWAEWHFPDASWQGCGLRYAKVKLLDPRDKMVYMFGVGMIPQEKDVVEEKKTVC